MKKCSGGHGEKEKRSERGKLTDKIHIEMFFQGEIL
jgi:hypothetical protein